MPVNIKLSASWRIKSDARNFILIKIDKSGREDIQGFYSDLGAAVEGLVDKEAKNFSSTSVQSFIEDQKALLTRLNKALTPLKIRVEVQDEH